jgi:modulator of FtsH protease
MSVIGPVNPLASWPEYFLAQAGAAAALTGLLFVALSFNLERIAADRTWLSRAATGLIYLALPVIVSLVALFPTRTAGPVAWTLVGIGIAATITLIGLDPGAEGTRTAEPTASGILSGFRQLFARPGHERLETAARLALTLIPSATTIIGAVLLLTASPAAGYVLAAAGLTSLTLGLLTAWILLVEIRRPPPRSNSR